MMQSKIYWMMGGSGSGKSVAAAVMREIGLYVIDADKVSHSVLKKGGAAYSEVLESFGSPFLGEDGEFDRKALGKAVFSDAAKLEILNKITHKHIKEEILRLSGGKETVIIDAPLPPDDFLEIDHLLYILAPPKVRIKRIAQRDNISEEYAALRLENQKHIDEYIVNADTIIENDGDIEKFKAKIKNWCEYEKII